MDEVSVELFCADDSGMDSAGRNHMVDSKANLVSHAEDQRLAVSQARPVKIEPSISSNASQRFPEPDYSPQAFVSPTSVQCHICGTHYKNTSSLRNHIRNVHLECKICRKVFQDFQVSEQHRKECSQRYSQSLFCTLCRSFFNTKVELDDHVATAHSVIDQDPQPAKDDEVCTGTFFNSNTHVELNEHIATAHSVVDRDLEPAKDDEVLESDSADEVLPVETGPATAAGALESSKVEEVNKDDPCKNAEKYIGTRSTDPTCRFCHKKFSELGLATDHVLEVHLSCELCLATFPNRKLTMKHRKTCDKKKETPFQADDADASEINDMDELCKDDPLSNSLWKYAEKYIDVSDVQPVCNFCHKKFSNLSRTAGHILRVHLSCTLCSAIFPNRSLTVEHRILCERRQLAKRKRVLEEGKSQSSVDGMDLPPENNRGESASHSPAPDVCSKTPSESADTPGGKAPKLMNETPGCFLCGVPCKDNADLQEHLIGVHGAAETSKVAQQKGGSENTGNPSVDVDQPSSENAANKGDVDDHGPQGISQQGKSPGKQMPNPDLPGAELDPSNFPGSEGNWAKICTKCGIRFMHNKLDTCRLCRRASRHGKTCRCMRCGEEFENWQALNWHVTMHNADKFECPHCYTLCHTSFELRRHLGECAKLCHASGMTCTSRSKTLGTEQGLESDKPDFDNKSIKNPAKVANRSSPRLRVLLNHSPGIAEDHMSKKPRRKETEKSRCKSCGIRCKPSHNRKTDKRKRCRNCSTRELPYRCARCGEPFNTARALDLHISFHRSNKFECPECYTLCLTALDWERHREECTKQSSNVSSKLHPKKDGVNSLKSAVMNDGTPCQQAPNTHVAEQSDASDTTLASRLESYKVITEFRSVEHGVTRAEQQTSNLSRRKETELESYNIISETCSVEHGVTRPKEQTSNLSGRKETEVKSYKIISEPRSVEHGVTRPEQQTSNLSGRKETEVESYKIISEPRSVEHGVTRLEQQTSIRSGRKETEVESYNIISEPRFVEHGITRSEKQTSNLSRRKETEVESYKIISEPRSVEHGVTRPKQQTSNRSGRKQTEVESYNIISEPPFVEHGITRSEQQTSNLSRRKETEVESYKIISEPRSVKHGVTRPKHQTLNLSGKKYMGKTWCKTCNKPYEKSHYCKNRGRKPFRCLKCGEQFKSWQALSVHAVLHKSGKFDCPQCHALCLTSLDWERHKDECTKQPSKVSSKVHSNKDGVTSVECAAVEDGSPWQQTTNLREAEQQKSNLLKTIGKSEKKCNKCGITYFHQHRCKSKSKSKRFRCDKCGDKLVSLKALETHISLHLLVDNPQRLTERKKHKGECTKQLSNVSSSVAMEVGSPCQTKQNLHEGEQSIQIKHFRTEQGLQSYKIIPEYFRCNICGDQLVNRRGLRRHMAWHVQGKKKTDFKRCKICNNKYKNVHDCKLRGIAGSVTCKRCGQVCKNHQSLNLHLALHKVTEFECPQCYTLCLTPQDFERHKCAKKPNAGETTRNSRSQTIGTEQEHESLNLHSALHSVHNFECPHCCTICLTSQDFERHKMVCTKQPNTGVTTYTSRSKKMGMERECESDKFTTKVYFDEDDDSNLRGASIKDQSSATINSFVSTSGASSILELLQDEKKEDGRQDSDESSDEITSNLHSVEDGVTNLASVSMNDGSPTTISSSSSILGASDIQELYHGEKEDGGARGSDESTEQDARTIQQWGGEIETGMERKQEPIEYGQQIIGALHHMQESEESNPFRQFIYEGFISSLQLQEPLHDAMSVGCGENKRVMGDVITVENREENASRLKVHRQNSGECMGGVRSTERNECVFLEGTEKEFPGQSGNKHNSDRRTGNARSESPGDDVLILENRERDRPPQTTKETICVDDHGTSGSHNGSERNNALVESGTRSRHSEKRNHSGVDSGTVKRSKRCLGSMTISDEVSDNSFTSKVADSKKITGQVIDQQFLLEVRDKRHDSLDATKSTHSVGVAREQIDQRESSPSETANISYDHVAENSSNVNQYEKESEYNGNMSHSHNLEQLDNSEDKYWVLKIAGPHNPMSGSTENNLFGSKDRKNSSSYSQDVYEEEYKCVYCEKSFSTMKGKESHESEEHLSCKICHAAFKTPKELLEHYKQCSIHGSFKCSICYNIFSSKTLYKAHLLKHKEHLPKQTVSLVSQDQS